MKGGDGGQIAFGKKPRQTKAGHVNVKECCDLIAVQGARGRRRERKRKREREGEVRLGRWSRATSCIPCRV